MSAFAIPDEQLEPAAAEGDDVKAAYLRELERERDLLIQAAAKGHRMRCLISPPVAPHGGLRPKETVKQRVERLLQFLGDPAQAGNSYVEWKVAAFRPSNMYVIGDFDVFEGFKKEDMWGFSLTLRTVDKNAIRDRARVFDELFEAAGEQVPPDDPGRVPKLREAAIKALEDRLRELCPEGKSGC
jgi:hypothetical protein